MLLVCFGSPIVDIIAHVDQHFLKKYDLTPDDTTKISEKTAEIFNEVVHKYTPVYQAGGSVTNTVRIFNWISKNCKSCYFGAVGLDFCRKIITDTLDKERIDYRFVEIENVPTGKCAVLVTGSARCLVTDFASKFFHIDNLPENGGKLIYEDADIVYISALFIGVSMETIRKVFRNFLERKKYIVVNLGAQFLCGTNPEDVTFMFRNADLVFGNKMEFHAFAEISGTNSNDSSKTLLKIHEKYDKKNRILVSTNGSESVLVLKNNEINKFEVEKIEDIVDTNGAGDAFVGGFLAKFVENKNLEDCVKCGLWCAKNVVQNIGCKFDNKLIYEC